MSDPRAAALWSIVGALLGVLAIVCALILWIAVVLK